MYNQESKSLPAAQKTLRTQGRPKSVRDLATGVPLGRGWRRGYSITGVSYRDTCERERKEPYRTMVRYKLDELPRLTKKRILFSN